jgi:predicted RNA-binding Zn-ribbon protein involved in translation (DUF1610 family)
MAFAATEKGEQMARLIDADALKEKAINVCYEDDYESDGFGIVYVRHIDEAPTIDAKPVKYGEWDDSGRYKFASGETAIRCTICGCALHEEEYRENVWYYCPVCGADMRERKEKKPAERTADLV